VVVVTSAHAAPTARSTIVIPNLSTDISDYPFATGNTVGGYDFPKSAVTGRYHWAPWP
jgi:hypothetical protein